MSQLDGPFVPSAVSMTADEMKNWLRYFKEVAGITKVNRVVGGYYQQVNVTVSGTKDAMLSMIQDCIKAAQYPNGMLPSKNPPTIVAKSTRGGAKAAQQQQPAYPQPQPTGFAPPLQGTFGQPQMQVQPFGQMQPQQNGFPMPPFGQPQQSMPNFGGQMQPQQNGFPMPPFGQPQQSMPMPNFGGQMVPQQQMVPQAPQQVPQQQVQQTKKSEPRSAEEGKKLFLEVKDLLSKAVERKLPVVIPFKGEVLSALPNPIVPSAPIPALTSQTTFPQVPVSTASTPKALPPMQPSAGMPNVMPPLQPSIPAMPQVPMPLPGTSSDASSLPQIPMPSFASFSSNSAILMPTAVSPQQQQQAALSPRLMNNTQHGLVSLPPQQVLSERSMLPQTELPPMQVQPAFQQRAESPIQVVEAAIRAASSPSIEKVDKTVKRFVSLSDVGAEYDTVLSSIGKLGKLTPEEAAILKDRLRSMSSDSFSIEVRKYILLTYGLSCMGSCLPVDSDIVEGAKVIAADDMEKLQNEKGATWVGENKNTVIAQFREYIPFFNDKDHAEHAIRLFEEDVNRGVFSLRAIVGYLSSPCPHTYAFQQNRGVGSPRSM